MKKEWDELKNRLEKQRDDKKLLGSEAHLVVCGTLRWMEEIERRTLPGRVADLIANFDHAKWESETRGQEPARWSEKFGLLVEDALRTGDTSKLEAYQE